jgi:hypothetical protein
MRGTLKKEGHCPLRISVTARCKSPREREQQKAEAVRRMSLKWGSCAHA